jgi:hypothetical protein
MKEQQVIFLLPDFSYDQAVDTCTRRVPILGVALRANMFLETWIRMRQFVVS